MFYTLLLVLLIIDGLVLVAVVLLQAGQGGGLASLGGGTTDLVLGGRQAVTILHKASWVTGSAFMVLALLLSVAASSRAIGESDVQRRLRQQSAPQQQLPAAPLETAPGPAPTTGTTGTTGATPAPVPPATPPAGRP
jgi:protein translocase SecG subunit